MEGDSVTLKLHVTEIREEDDVLWTFGTEKSLIAKIDKEAKTSFIDNGTDGRFRDRLNLNNQTGSLTITNITTEHAGVYQLEISGVTLTSKTFNVSVYAHLPVPVISSNSSQCSSSSNCSLLCSVVNVSDVTLSWYKGNSLLSSISVSDLSISLSLPLEVEYQDKNTYSCVLNNPISNQTRHLDISQLCHTCSASDGHFTSQTVSLIVLISAALVGSLLIAAAFGIFCICRRNRKTDQEAVVVVVVDNEAVQARDEEIIYADPTFYKRNERKLEEISGLLLSSSEEVDVESPEPPQPLPRSPHYEELVEVLTSAVAKLNIAWPAQHNIHGPQRSRLDERFLWTNPVENYGNVGAAEEYGYKAMPRVEQTLAGYLSPVVLEALCKPPFEPIEEISDRLLTIKAALLLALTSLKRVGDLQSLSVASSHIEFAPGMAKAFLYPRVPSTSAYYASGVLSSSIPGERP
ncbi:uncharacterized protein [Garra rufa]|uniref:uncharacterized protein n=1 Tax=Garra rufa TaxID=137080 RepID=UPI003CCE666A